MVTIAGLESEHAFTARVALRARRILSHDNLSDGANIVKADRLVLIRRREEEAKYYHAVISLKKSGSGVPSHITEGIIYLQKKRGVQHPINGKTNTQAGPSVHKKANKPASASVAAASAAAAAAQAAEELNQNEDNDREIGDGLEECCHAAVSTAALEVPNQQTPPLQLLPPPQPSHHFHNSTHSYERAKPWIVIECECTPLFCHLFTPSTISF